MRFTRPYLCVYADKVHAAQFVHIQSLMTVKGMCLLRVGV